MEEEAAVDAPETAPESIAINADEIEDKPSAAICAMFKKLDIDADGKLSVEELEHMFLDMGFVAASGCAEKLKSVAAYKLFVGKLL